MTGTRAPTSPPTLVPPQRVRRRRRRGARRRRALLFAGCSLIVAGAIVIGWLAWQFWGTNWVSERHQGEVVAEIEAGWGEGRSSADTEFGRATAILHVPRFGSDYAMPVLEGSSDKVLAAGIGHMSETAGAGEEGNYVLAYADLRTMPTIPVMVHASQAFGVERSA
jgi:sortase A